MQDNVKFKIKDLQKRAWERKLSYSNAKSQECVSLEKEYFNYMKKDLYNYIGGNKQWN